MRLIRYLRHSLGAVALIFALLIVQAACDLALPNYTSQIVDVGIQQSGIEHAATDELTAETHDEIAAALDGDDAALFDAAYALTDRGTYELTDEGRARRDELDAVVAAPLAAAHGLSSDSDASASDEAASTPDASASDASASDASTSEEAASASDASASDASTSASALDASTSDESALVEQQAIAAARAEYEALGRDAAAIQTDYLVRVGLSMAGVAACGMAASVVIGFVGARTGAKIGRDLRRRLFERVVSFSDAEVGSFSAASLITRGTNDIQLVQNVTIMMLRMVLYSPILAVGGIVMVMRTNISMSWIIVLAVAVVLTIVVVLMKVAMPKFRIMQKLVDRVNLVSREALTGLPVVRAFNREGHEEARFEQASGDLMRTQLFTNRVMTFMMPCMTLVMNGVSVLIVWVGGGFVDAGAIQTGDLIAFITYSMVIIMSFLMIGMVSIMLPRADVAAGRIDEVLAAETSVRDPAAPRDAGFGSGSGAEISFDDVTFRYEGSEGEVLSHVSFTAEAGKTTAIIGATGSGKSTALKLVLRFYDVTGGAVRVDGIDVRDLSQHALRRQFGYVPQQSFLFSGTVRSNVSYSAGTMPDARVEEALSIAQAADFVAEKDGGADAPIAQGGSNVSGGQRQRLAIARAVAADARAYLFDDSFSALDYRTDAALRAALSQRLSGRTVVIVAQRVATVLHADRIVVLDEGRLVGVGTHKQLMATCEEYREIALSQLSEAELAKGGDAA